jgi:hypothetical protein
MWLKFSRFVSTTVKKIFFFVDNAFISPFNTQTMHIKLFYTKQHCYVSLKTSFPGGIRTRVFLFLRRMRCPLRHAATGHLNNSLAAERVRTHDPTPIKRD